MATSVAYGRASLQRPATRAVVDKKPMAFAIALCRSTALVGIDSRAARCYVDCVKRATTALFFLIAILYGCDDKENIPFTFSLNPGQETEAFTQSPVPERLVLHTVLLDGTSSPLADEAWPSGTFSLGVNTNQQVALEAFGYDAAGIEVLRGATVFHPLWQHGREPLTLFLGRVGVVSRPLGSPEFSHVGGMATVIDGRFIVSVGGEEAFSAGGVPSDPSTFSAYNLALWQQSSVTATLPRRPRSMVTVQGRWALVVDVDGASWFDFFTFISADAVAPSGMAFAEVVGGRVLYGEDGEAYLVGPSRKGVSSSAVLRVGWDGALSVVRTGSERSGVAAVYVPGRGLLLAGGHREDPGVLLLSPESSTFSSLAFPVDPVNGAMAVSLGDDRVLLAGGVEGDAPAPTRVLDLRCMIECGVTNLGAVVAPLGFSYGWASVTRADEVLFVGEDEASMETRVERVGGLGAVPFVERVALREPRVGAAPVALFGRTVAIVGGRRVDATGVPSIEVYIPE